MTNQGEYDLVGVDSHPFSILGYVRDAMRTEGYSVEDRKLFSARAMLLDYDELLSASLDMIDKLNGED